MMDIQKVRQLLGSVALIREKYTEIAKIIGENFNVFNILGLSTYEVRTHSAFLAELLDPHGSHSKGDVYLREFARELNFELDYSMVSVEVEKHMTEGNIDILVSDKNRAIIIENKIYAKDQNRQLQRYFDYGTRVYGRGNFVLLYLTLDGKDADEISYGNLMVHNDYRLVSYKLEIINWLNKCLKESSEFPLIRETIVQYIHLIKKLTHQTMNTEMQEKIVKEVLTGGYIEAAFEVINSGDRIKQTIITEFENQLKKFAEENQLSIEISTKGKVFGTIDTEAIFIKEDSRYPVSLCFINNYEGIRIGQSDEKKEWVTGDDKRGYKIWYESSWADVYSGEVTKKLGKIILSFF